MKEIKVRCYVKYDNFMFSQEENDSDYFIVSNGNGFACIYDNGFEQKYLKKDEYVIEQYIGINDKNGVKPFEGDIIKLYELQDDCEIKESICVIESVNGTSEIAAWHESEKKNGTGWYLSIGELCIINGAPQTEFEVIGNIHNNLELLE